MKSQVNVDIHQPIGYNLCMQDKVLHEFFENLPHDRYDIVSKDIFGTFTEDLLRRLTDIPELKFVEQLETELPTVEIRRMDTLSKVEVDHGEVLVHIEFQVSRENTTEILKRKVGYFGRCFERYGLPILSFTVYLRSDAGSNDPGVYSQDFPKHNVLIEYQVIRLSEFDGQSVFDTDQTSLMAFTPLMKPPEGVSRVEWVERCHRMTFALPLASELQNNLLIWQWILSGLIVDPAEIRHLLEGPMLESSTYRYILQQGIERGARESTIEGILEALEVQFHESGVQALKPVLESIEELQHLKVLRRAAMQVPSLDAFKRLLTSNGN